MGPYWNRVTLIMNLFTTYLEITPATFRNTDHTEIKLEDGTVIKLDEIESSDDAVELLRSLGLHGEYADKLISRLNAFSKPKEPKAPEPKEDPFAFLDAR